MTFEEWFHKEYEPSDLQIKQYAERKEGLHIPAELYLEDIQKAYEAGQKNSETQIEKMKCCQNCRKFHNLSYDCTCAEVCNEWELADKE